MIRTKMPNLIHKKTQTRSRFGPQNPNPNPNILLQQPWWFQQYHTTKQTLTLINNNNRTITNLARQYQVNPSVYALRQVQRAITDNCQMIQGVERWVGGFRYSAAGTAQERSQRAMTGYIQAVLTEEIMSVFSNKQLISSVNAELDHNASLSRSRISNPNFNPNASFQNPSLHNASFAQQSPDRNQIFLQVSNKIQNLNGLLRRMNTMVVGQGDLVNRIDENLVAGHGNMVSANQQLKRRVDREQGQGQFTLEGKVNKVIMGLYVLNLVIILLFFLKHLIF